MSKAPKQGFGSLIAEQVRIEMNAVGPQAQPAANNQLVQRTAAISKMSSDIVYDQNEWVDPALCRPSAENARDYGALTYENCAELIESIQAEGRQRFAATVRETHDPDVPYEIVAGLRRHWAISWLRANNYSDFKYLINVQKMDDETAFRLSDLENRARTDITDMERAKGYKKALAAHYSGRIEQMADRLKLSRRQLNRYINLASLDDIIVEALGGPAAVGIRSGNDLHLAIENSTIRSSAMKTEAAVVVQEQLERTQSGQSPIDAREVEKRLIRAATSPRKIAKTSKAVPYRNASGKLLIEFSPGNARSGSSIKVSPSIAADSTLEEAKEMMGKILEGIFARKNR